MNKRAFLLGEETLKIIIAVVCIGFLIYFLTAVYFSNIKNKELKEAEATIERISDVIKNSETVSESVDALNPDAWYLFSFVGGKKPDSCSKENCLCICKKVLVDNFLFIWKDGQLNECRKAGVCLVVKDLKSFEKIRIEKGGETSIEINKQEGVEIIEQ